MTDSANQTIARNSFVRFKKLNHSGLSDDAAFERFAIDLALRRHSVSSSDIERGIISGTDDGGIDGFYVLLNGSELVESDSIRITKRKDALRGLQIGVPIDIFIIQAKKETNWDTNVFPKIGSTIQALFDVTQTAADLRSFPLNESLVEKALTLRKLRANLAMLAPTMNLRIQYVCLAHQTNVNSYMKTKAAQLRKWLVDNLPTGSRSEVDYVGDAAVVTKVRVSADFKARLKLKKLPMRDAKALVGLVSIKDYLAFLRRDRSKVVRDEMFAVNVRDYAGSNTRVNDAIGETLAADSASFFWWLNNGIAIIADKAEDPLELEWILTNPLIVNGLQTSHVIHEKDLEGAITRKRLNDSVLVRVITESDPGVRESIIGGTNNQTAITGIQLHANEEKQIRIEDFLRAKNWYYERRRYQYRGKQVPASRVRNITELGQAVMAYRLLLPDTARARPMSLLGKSSGWENIFRLDRPEELYAKSLNVVEAVDEFLRTPGAKSIADDPTNARYYLTSGFVLHASGVKKVDDFAQIPSLALKENPKGPNLLNLHEVLYEEVAKLDDGKTARDRLFKASKLKIAFFGRIIALNNS